LWEGGFKDTLAAEAGKITIGPCTSWEHFTGPVIGKPAFDKITGIIEKAKKEGGEVLVGGQSESALNEQDGMQLMGVFRRQLEGILHPTYGHRDQGPQVDHHDPGDLRSRHHRE
jgi:hypothetical protein